MYRKAALFFFWQGKISNNYIHKGFNPTKSILSEYSLPKVRKYLQEGVSEAGR
jgi:hypothetical protein